MPEIVIDAKALNAIWRAILPIEVKKWAIFKYGTTVLCHDEDKDVTEHALEVMKEHGPVVAGTPLGDFNVGLAANNPGLLTAAKNRDNPGHFLDER